MRERNIADVEKLSEQEMTRGGMVWQVTGRGKHLWWIRQKMRRTGRSFEDIHDKIGFRVITDSVASCYQALGIAHSAWTPHPGRLKA